MSKAKYLVSEKQVKKALKIDSFRNLSKDKVIEFISLIPRMDKELAIAIINQFSAYVELAIDMVAQLNIMCENALKSNDASQKDAIDAYKMILDSLNERLKSGDITLEERQWITEKMIEVANYIAAKDTENKKFIEKIVISGATVISGVLLLGAAILGVNVSGRSIPELDDDNEDIEDDDETEDDEET